jgi:hypothetical protein
VCLLALPWIKNGAFGSMFCDTQRHQMHCDSQPACPYQRRLSVSASKHDKTIGASVCVCAQDVLRGWLDWKALHFKYLSFMAEFWELFDTPTNILHDSQEKQWLFPQIILKTGVCNWDAVFPSYTN